MNYYVNKFYSEKHEPELSQFYARSALRKWSVGKRLGICLQHC